MQSHEIRDTIRFRAVAAVFTAKNLRLKPALGQFSRSLCYDRCFPLLSVALTLARVLRTVIKMIDATYRFWIEEIQVTGAEWATSILDWDQRRLYRVVGNESIFEENEELAIEFLRQHIENIDQHVHTIVVDDRGALVSTSSDPEQDTTCAVYYPSFVDAPSLKDSTVIELSKLEELKRFGPAVDLARYVDEKGAQQMVVFKYGMIFQRRLRIWRELHLLKSLPEHPNLVRLDRVVLDDARSQVLGYTTPYISGGTLDDDHQRVFRLSWLHQLTSVVDYLNLEVGIVHQDIAPRNILIDPGSPNLETEKIRLFDFDYGAFVGLSGCIPSRNDVKGVVFTLYEIVTLDDSYRRVPHEEQDLESVTNLKEWPIRRNLDSDITAFREHLSAWVQQRKTHRDGASEDEGLTPTDIPEISPPSPVVMSIDEEGKPVYERSVVQMKIDALKFGNKLISWERAPDKTNQ